MHVPGDPATRTAATLGSGRMLQQLMEPQSTRLVKRQKVRGMC